MKVTVSRQACVGHGQCARFAPEVYDLDDDGYCAVNELEVAGELEGPAQIGADNCPERAISVIASSVVMVPRPEG